MSSKTRSNQTNMIIALSKLRNTLKLKQPNHSATRSILNLLIITILLLLWLIHHHQPGPAGQPEHSLLQGGDHHHHQTSTLVVDRPIIQIPSSIQPTSAQEALSSRAAEAWLSRGIILSGSEPLTPTRPIDLLWTWANDSAPIPIEQPARIPSAYLYRQHDELRFSLRSSLQSLPEGFVRSRLIITADQPISPPSTENSTPQITHSRPNWLPTLPIEHLSPPLILKHHSHIFRFIHPHKLLQAAQWSKNYLPSHNSLAIESQFGHLDGIRDNLLYLNDDCFFINKFSQGDFASELFGPVFRIQFDLKVADDQLDRSGTDPARGEWPSLGYSNYLLSQRFGSRERRYLSHLPKVLNIHIMREVSEIWKEEIFLTASSRVRGQRRELNMMFLTTWYQIEKHREAMLHSFIMLQSDANQDGLISVHEWGAMMKRIGAREEGGMIEVTKPLRPRRGVVEDGLGDSKPRETDYEWLSSDGYPLVGPDDPAAVPDYRHRAPAGPKTFCRLNVTDCFLRPVVDPTGHLPAVSSESLLRRIASERPECGDCLLALLVGQQPAGFDALLPPKSFRTTLAKWVEPKALAGRPFASFHKRAPHTSFFSSPFPRASRFARRAFLIDDPRMWAVRNIQRYQYVLGNTPSRFDVLTTYSTSRKVLANLSSKFNKINNTSVLQAPEPSSSSLRATNEAPAAQRALLVTINDRIFGPHLAQVHDLFTAWLHASWPTPAPWEKN
ncbi:hypothetical protein PGT21_023499 [Puccinia graminis f. sp. tritici]|uniref:EF-hand domain-containing protein n=2 Tax=Puccinia graminis f. sp. tritici TaxID=56615 RepID=E3KCY5_PUCGT|nr:uncharacterized protein PGTG_07660 [Puccinia graminis f. sp. tritici CRL 75-36-700-3]EFP82263.2 hypothetical protein PGTG_07660 [Puccinia graminis f. sp. tritici CRL 75-36-700-3]KAA1065063.1 hypothetical protein PGT21_023499 [Puccinia graminis f. sp. tritici]